MNIKNIQKRNLLHILVIGFFALFAISCANNGGSGSDSNSSSEYIPTAILLFSTAAVDGNFGGRSGADTLCANAQPVAYTCNQIRAFISTDGFNGADEIIDMPTNYSVPTDLPLKGPTDVTVANDWADAIDGTWITCLGTSCENLTTPSDVITSAFYWTGSYDDTTGNPTYCSGWTSNANADTGRSGFWTKSTSGGHIGGSSKTCDLTQPLICLCY
ncbi:MAG: hypothetical protein ABUK01_05375 [Leptospirales bacterium]